MGAQPLLRQLAALIALVGSASVAAAEPLERVALVPTAWKPSERRALLRAAAAALPADLALVDGEAGEILARLDGGLDGALAALELAIGAEAAGRCAEAEPAAASAALALAAGRAAGLEVFDAAREAWTVRWRCADRAGDAALARRAADALRSFVAGDPPPGIDGERWAHYPALDALGNRPTIPIEVRGPTGAAVWVDLARVGDAPLTLYLPEGEHVVAVVKDGRATAAWVDARWPPPTVELALPPRADLVLVARVAAVLGDATPVAVRALLAAAGARFAITGQAGALVAWDGPRRLGQATTVTAAIALLRRAAWQTADARPQGGPLAGPSPAAADDGVQPWWVYTSVAAAVALVGGVILVHELADDRQRIRVEL